MTTVLYQLGLVYCDFSKKCTQILKCHLKYQYCSQHYNGEKSIDNLTFLQEPWAVQHLPGAAHHADPAHGKFTPFWSFKLLQDFCTRKQLYTLFLLPNIKDVHTRTHCCHFQKRCRACRGYHHRYPVGAAQKILWDNQPGKFVPCGPEGQGGHSAQLSTGWELTGLTCKDH